VGFEFRHHPAERKIVPMLIGYARVSTLEQSLDLQTDALNRAGCEKLFTDKPGGARAALPGLDQALAHLRKEDTLVVWKLDRLGRSIRHLIETVGQLEERKVGFRSLQESIDTTTSGGKLVFHVFAALAEFERDIIRERTRAGLEARAMPRTSSRCSTCSACNSRRGFATWATSSSIALTGAGSIRIWSRGSGDESSAT
jgi:hypothetical protein